MNAPASASGSKRLLSLDILRGLTIALMIMVNNSGDGAWRQMHHAEWNGMTMTDLVFPTFLFVVGVSIVFSTAARLRHGDSRLRLAGHALRRTVILILFGIVVNGFPFFHLDHLRFYGVLQRIGLCYFAVTLFYLWDRRVWTKVALLVVALVGYWALVAAVLVPGAGMPGRDVPLLDKDMNLVAWVDRQLMPGHLYEDWTSHNTRDPEGLLSDIPALGTALLGLLTGLWLSSEHTQKKKALGLLVGAASCLAIGYFWSIWFPLNKKMWTSSYVLVAAGYALTVFALAYWAVELRGWGKDGWTRAVAWPWIVFGSNAIVAYMISELLGTAIAMIPIGSGANRTDLLALLNLHVFDLIGDSGWRCFLYAAFYAAVCFVPVWMLYRKKIFLKV